MDSLGSESDDYSYEEQEFGYDDIPIMNYIESPARSRSPSPVRYPSKRSGNGAKITNYVKNTKTSTMSYKDTMKLINYIFISNYVDKRNGNAILVDSAQIVRWINHFKETNFEVPNSKRYIYNADSNFSKSIQYINQIPFRILNDYKIINDILLLGNGKISLCGGSLIQLINYGANEHDWDLFFHCETIEEGDRLLNECLQLIENGGQGHHITHSVNQRVHTVEFDRIQIQFIKRIYKSKDQVLLGFDLAPSRIGYNHIDGLYATVCGGMSIAMKCFPLDTTQRSMSFGYRLTKYMSKGFYILYPGLPVKFDGEIKTTDGTLKCNNDVINFCYKRGFESDYDGNEGDHMNWYYLLTEKYHLVNFSGDMNDIMDLTEEFVEKSIRQHDLFEVNKNYIGSMNVKINKSFLGDRYKDFINAVVVDEDDNKGCDVWQERCKWYVEKGIEAAQQIKDNRWKTENPGSQSFGKFNPILEHPKMWYGDNYQSVEVGIKTPQFKSFVYCLMIKNIPDDIINVICDFWLEAEVNHARDYLFSLNNPTSAEVNRSTVHTIYNLGI